MIVSVLKADVKNSNGRIYPKSVLKNIVKQFKEMDKPLWGEYPGRKSFTYGSLIDLSRASHEITDISLSEDETVLLAEIKLFPLPHSPILAAMFKDKNIVYRPRGFGSLNLNGEIYDYKLVTIDAIDADDDAFKDFI